MSNQLSEPLRKEEQIVGELARLGVGYLSRQGNESYSHRRSPEDLLVELVRQPSSRVRTALIALFLAHPEYAAHVSDALPRLTEREALSFKFFYTAAVFLQRRYNTRLRVFLDVRWRELPDFFSVELGVSGSTPAVCLQALGRIHARQTGVKLNWVGTYQNAAHHLLRQWELEKIWNQ